MIPAVLVEFGARRIHRQHHLFARFVPGAFNGFHDDLKGCFVCWQAWRKTALITDIGATAAVVDHLLEAMVDFAAPA
jgi:hypothetical protein